MCLDDQILNTYLDGELAEPWRTQVAEHLTYCSACRRRYEQLSHVHELVSSSRLANEEIEIPQRKVLQFLEKNYLEKQKKPSFFHREFRVKTPMLLSVAAILIALFISVLIGGQQGQITWDEIIPSMSSEEKAPVVQVRATDNFTASQILDTLTLEEILQYLDARGYEVDVRLKGIQPMEYPDNTIP